MEFCWYIYKKKVLTINKNILKKNSLKSRIRKNETKFLVQCKQAINNALITTLIQVSAHLNQIFDYPLLNVSLFVRPSVSP